MIRRSIMGQLGHHNHQPLKVWIDGKTLTLALLLLLRRLELEAAETLAAKSDLAKWKKVSDLLVGMYPKQLKLLLKQKPAQADQPGSVYV